MAALERYIELENGDFCYDLFPYKIKDVNNFYHRDHPKKLNPHSFQYKKYWEDGFLRNSLEGKWIDDDGTWVFMMPKLFFYINYVIIPDEDRNEIEPRLRDNEWIMFTYFLCSEGFSGFDGDDDYTCNKYVEKLETGVKLEEFEKRKLEADSTTRKQDGSYKKYVNPWIYLTETYLLTDNRNKPLGQAMYSNGYYHVLLLASRGLAKSFATFMGDFLHEWYFGNIRRYEDRFKVGNPAIFGITSPKKKALSRSIANFSRSYFFGVGGYDFPTKKKDKTVKYFGPFHKNMRGTWAVSDSGNNIQHIVKTKQGQEIISGSQCNIALMGTTDNKVFTGDRFRRGYIEEVGFVADIDSLYAAAKDAFEVGENQWGSLFMIGTSGDPKTIGPVKEMFENPKPFNIFSIPNYWSKIPNKFCGLFLPAVYKSEDFKENGNTNLKEALLSVIKKREYEKAEKTTQQFTTSLMWNPLYPKELLRPTTRSVIPQQEIAAHREYLEQSGLWKEIAMVGSFGYKLDGGIEFRLDKEKTLSPITKWGRDKDLEDKTGAWIIYEEPPSYIPDDLYHILYDPYAKGADGTSLQSLLVYKGKYTGYGEGQQMQDTIVAAYIGRLDTLDKSFEEAIKAARYFNAKVFPESNVTGFDEYVYRHNLEHLTRKPSVELLKSIKGSTWRAYERNKLAFGVRVNEDMNMWSVNKIAEWLNRVVAWDDKNIPIKRNYQNILDIRLLSELENFDFENKPDFDSVSALMLLPYIIGELNDAVEVPVTDEDDLYAKYEVKYNPPKPVRPKAKINNW